MKDGEGDGFFFSFFFGRVEKRGMAAGGEGDEGQVEGSVRAVGKRWRCGEGGGKQERRESEDEVRGGEGGWGAEGGG